MSCSPLSRHSRPPTTSTYPRSLSVPRTCRLQLVSSFDRHLMERSGGSVLVTLDGLTLQGALFNGGVLSDAASTTSEVSWG